MKRALLLAAALLFLAAGAFAQEAPAGPPSQTPAVGGPNFVDANGDGICDLNQPGVKRGKGRGPGDGTGNRGVGPRDGSGYGPGAKGTCPNCTGNGPGGTQGQGRARGPRR
jgi:hypothetical protein